MAYSRFLQSHSCLKQNGGSRSWSPESGILADSGTARLALVSMAGQAAAPPLLVSVCVCVCIQIKILPMRTGSKNFSYKSINFWLYIQYSNECTGRQLTYPGFRRQSSEQTQEHSQNSALKSLQFWHSFYRQTNKHCRHWIFARLINDTLSTHI